MTDIGAAKGLEELFAAADRDGNHELDFKEFLVCLAMAHVLFGPV